MCRSVSTSFWVFLKENDPCVAVFLVYPWEEGKLEVSFSDILHKTLIVLILNTHMYDVTCFLSLKIKPMLYFKKYKTFYLMKI